MDSMKKNEITNINKNILLLFIGRFISDFGSALFKFSLSLYVLDISGSSTEYSLILILTILPGMLMSIFAGTIIDRYDRKKIIFISDVLSALSSLLLFLFIEVLPGQLFIFGVGVVLISIIQTFLNLGINSSIYNIVPDNMVTKVNGYFQAMGAILTIISPIIGAIFYSSFGIKTVLIINIFTYFFGAITTMMIQFVSIDKNGEKEMSLKDGMLYIFSYMKKYNAIQLLMLMLFMLTLIYYPLTNVALQNIMRLNVQATSFQLSCTIAAGGGE